MPYSPIRLRVVLEGVSKGCYVPSGTNVVRLSGLVEGAEASIQSKHPYVSINMIHEHRGREGEKVGMGTDQG